MSFRPIPADLLPWALTALGREDALGQSTLALVAGDASARRYFRLALSGQSYIVAESPPETEKNAEFVVVRDVLARSGVHVPALYGSDLDRGYLLLEDLGDRTLLAELTPDTVDDHYDRALEVLHRMARLEVETLDLPEYGRDLLVDELQRFTDWFVVRLLGHDLTQPELALCERLGERLVDSALQQPRVLVHRDFHSRNLMLMAEEGLGVIDFQDAVIGPVTYDLVSLLRDCYIRWPGQQVRGWALSYRAELVSAGLLEPVKEATFLRWFDWIGLQRHIKVLGTFARLYLRDSKPGYLEDLPLVVAYVREILAAYAGEEPVFAEFTHWFDRVLGPKIALQPWSETK